MLASLLSLLGCGPKTVDLADLDQPALTLTAEPDQQGHTVLTLRLGWKARPLLGSVDTCPRLREDLVATVGSAKLQVHSRGDTTRGEYGLHCTGAVFHLAFTDPAAFPAGAPQEVVLEDPSRRISLVLHDVWSRRRAVPRQPLEARPGETLEFDWLPDTDALVGADLGWGGRDKTLPRPDTLLWDGADYAVPRNYGGLSIEGHTLRVRIPDDAPPGELELRFSALILTPAITDPGVSFESRDSWPWLMPPSATVTVLPPT